jgi:hypothetical protein
MDNHLNDGVAMYPCIGTHPQHWIRTQDGLLMNKNKCLEASLPTSMAIMADCDKSKQSVQRWTVVSASEGWVQLKMGEMCIDGDSIPLKLKPCSQACSSFWRFMANASEMQKVSWIVHFSKKKRERKRTIFSCLSPPFSSSSFFVLLFFVLLRLNLFDSDKIRFRKAVHSARQALKPA